MNIQQNLINSTKVIKTHSPSARLDAEVLLCFVLNKSKEYLYTHPEYELTIKQQTTFTKLINKRKTGWPVAYLTGHKEFYGLDFIVTPKVLIPRPETETLVTMVIQYCKEQKFLFPSLTIADIGTGSGAIAIALAKNLSTAKIYATDYSPAALTIAKKNAKLNQTKITFLTGNLIKPILNKKIDLLVANLPYLPTKKNFHLAHEPRLALYSGADGLKHYRLFFQQLTKMKYLPLAIFIEHGPKQFPSLKKIILSHFPHATITTNSCGVTSIQLSK